MRLLKGFAGEKSVLPHHILMRCLAFMYRSECKQLACFCCSDMSLKQACLPVGMHMETSTDTTHSSKPKTVRVLQMAATCQCLQRELAHVCTPCKFRNRHAESEHVGFTAERACSVTLMPFAKPAKASLPARDSTTSSLRKPLVSRVGVSRSLRLAFRRASSSFSSGLITLICPCVIRGLRKQWFHLF